MPRVQVDVEWKCLGISQTCRSIQPSTVGNEFLHGRSPPLPPDCSQLIDIVRGLNYLHSQSVVHGDLKGVCDLYQFHLAISLIPHAQPNILIDDNKNALLCDFGLASITADAESEHASTVNSAGSIRWMAPERLSIFEGDPEPQQTAIRVTKESDMYSLAMVVIEVRPPLPPLVLNLTPD